jgi:hypothetical protein
MRLMRNACGILVALLTSATIVHGQTRTYRLEQIVSMFREGGMTPVQVLTTVRTTGCISFAINASAANELTRAGGDVRFLEQLRGMMCSPTPSRASSTASRADSAFLLIEGRLPPAWKRKVNDNAPTESRTISYTKNGFFVLTAPGWCQVRDTLIYRSGDTVRWTPQLRARSWVGEC